VLRSSKSVVLVVGLVPLTITCTTSCSLPAYLADHRRQALYAEIQALAADRSSTNDSDCGAVALNGCGGLESFGEIIVYSRAAMDEDVILERVREYNELLELIPACHPVQSATTTPSAISENGVCVAGSR